jgi:hypothetical protein
VKRKNSIWTRAEKLQSPRIENFIHTGPSGVSRMLVHVPTSARSVTHCAGVSRGAANLALPQPQVTTPIASATHTDLMGMPRILPRLTWRSPDVAAEKF